MEVYQRKSSNGSLQIALVTLPVNTETTKNSVTILSGYNRRHIQSFFVRPYGVDIFNKETA